MNPEPGAVSFEVAMPEGFDFGTMDMPGADGPTRQPAVEGVPAPVEILRYSANSVALSVLAPSDGYVVLCDAYYPKWRASVNGERVNVLRANCTVRAVPVTGGENSVEFVYDASSFRRAGRVSLATLIACIGMGALDIILNARAFGRAGRRSNDRGGRKMTRQQ